MDPVFGQVTVALALVAPESVFAKILYFWAKVVTGRIFIVCLPSFHLGLVGKAGVWMQRGAVSQSTTVFNPRRGDVFSMRITLLKGDMSERRRRHHLGRTALSF